MSSNNNTIYLNNFTNTYNVESDSSNTWKSPTKICYFYSPSHKNYIGNYYDDYTGADTNGDGIGDTPYDLPGSEPDDDYPLMEASDNYSFMAWYLSNPYTMYKGDMTKPGATVNFFGGNSKVWLADEQAQTEVTFPAGVGEQMQWAGQLAFTPALGSGHSLLVEVGRWDGSSFTPGGPDATITGDGTATVFTFTTDAESFTVPDGQYLALRVTNQGDSLYSVQVGGSWSYLSAPDTACPEYPVPELPTIILFSAGLVGLGSYVWLRRRKIRNTNF